jgi:hypothetical protein
VIRRPVRCRGAVAPENQLSKRGASNVSQPTSSANQDRSETTDRYYNSRSWVGRQRDRAGRMSHGCIAMLLGLPLPIVILAFLWRGCD